MVTLLYTDMVHDLVDFGVLHLGSIQYCNYNNRRFAKTVASGKLGVKFIHILLGIYADYYVQIL